MECRRVIKNDIGKLPIKNIQVSVTVDIFKSELCVVWEEAQAGAVNLPEEIYGEQSGSELGDTHLNPLLEPDR